MSLHASEHRERPKGVLRGGHLLLRLELGAMELPRPLGRATHERECHNPSLNGVSGESQAARVEARCEAM